MKRRALNNFRERIFKHIADWPGPGHHTGISNTVWRDAQLASPAMTAKARHLRLLQQNLLAATKLPNYGRSDVPHTEITQE